MLRAHASSEWAFHSVFSEEQLVRLSVTKLLSNLGPGDVPEIAPDVLDSLLSLKRSVESHDCRLSLLVHMPDGTHHSVNI